MANRLPSPNTGDDPGAYAGGGGAWQDPGRGPEGAPIDAGAVLDLADAIDPRYRVLVLLLAFVPGVSREGIRACRRRDVDLLHSRMRTEVWEQDVGGGHVSAAPKNESARWSTLPAFLVGELSRHLDGYAQSGSDSYVFTGPEGGPLDPAHWHKSFRKAREAVGLPDIRPHDLRQGRGYDHRPVGCDHPGDNGPARPPLPDRR